MGLIFKNIDNLLTGCIIDAARLGAGLDDVKKIAIEISSLYKGISKEKLEGVAPYLCRCEEGSAFNSFLFEKGWGNSWGIFVSSPAPIGELYKHFRHFLIVQDETGEELYFRYYDPRVLRIFLPTCTQQQLKEFFGPVEYYVCEDENPDYALVFSLQEGKLKRAMIDLTKEIGIQIRPKSETKASIKNADDVIV